VAEFFSAVIGIGFLMCAGTGLICALAYGGREGPTFTDPGNIRSHWRGLVQIGLSMMGIGIVGAFITAVA
jgi:hypothetical protein